MTAKVVLLASGKGGVGKSVICAGAAYHLASLGYKTLVLEVGMRCMDLLLGVAEEALYDLTDVLAGRCEPIKAIYASPLQERLFLMPSTLHPDATSQSGLLLRLCKGLRQYYDYILIEAPAGLAEPLAECASAADLALLVVTPDPIAVRGARTVSDYLDSQGLTDQRIVVNQVRTSYGRLVGLPHIDAVIDAILEPLLAVIPYEPSLPGQFAHSAVVPVTCVAGQALVNLAKRLAGESVDLAMW